MNMNIHIEGFGITGTLLALMLDRQGIEFTWSDNESSQTAWNASTGAIYPAASRTFGNDDACWRVWQEWHDSGLMNVMDLSILNHLDPRATLSEPLEECNFWFNHRSCAPHGGRYPLVNRLPNDHGLRQAQPSSFHFNAQLFVPWAWNHWSDRRIDSTRDAVASTKVIAHGFGARLSHAYWGWTRRVRLKTAEEYNRDGNRPAFYFREGRFVMAYAYPIAGTQLWYAGSSIIKQAADKMRSLEMEPKYDRWKDNFLRLSGGAVEIIEEERFIEGWRPAAAKTDKDWAVWTSRDTVALRPCWNNGIRHFPHQWCSLAELLDIDIDEKERVTP